MQVLGRIESRRERRRRYHRIRLLSSMPSMMTLAMSSGVSGWGLVSIPYEAGVLVRSICLPPTMQALTLPRNVVPIQGEFLDLLCS